MHAVSMLSLPARRWPSISEMAVSESVPSHHTWRCDDCIVSRSDISVGMRVTQLRRKQPWWSMTRGSKVRGKLDKGDKPRKGEAQRCAGVCKGVQGCTKVHRGVQRCTEGCTRWCASHEGARLAKKRVHMGAQKLENGKMGVVGT